MIHLIKYGNGKEIWFNHFTSLDIDRNGVLRLNIHGETYFPPLDSKDKILELINQRWPATLDLTVKDYPITRRV
jgi:hypothetical protein